jgi:hypothetical protein
MELQTSSQTRIGQISRSVTFAIVWYVAFALGMAFLDFNFHFLEAWRSPANPENWEYAERLVFLLGFVASIIASIKSK